MLELRNVTKKFNLTGNASDTRIALDNVNLTINDGEFITIIGGNGSGKSTTMNIITGSLMPDSGSVLLNGVDITKMKEYQRAKFFGRVFQDPMMGTAANMSVFENLEIAYRRGANHSPFKFAFRKADREVFKKLVSQIGLGLEDRLNQKVGVMSGGQRQALTLLMATMPTKKPYKRLLKMYQKFSGLDPVEAKNEFETFIHENRVVRDNKIKAIKIDKLLSRNEKLEQIDIAKDEYDRINREKFNFDKQILLLDEHTAALDPKTAKNVLELTNKVVREKEMTTLMVTHNMKDAITYGDRLIMFHSGHIIYDVKGEEKSKLTVEDLLRLFDEADKKVIEE